MFWKNTNCIFVSISCTALLLQSLDCHALFVDTARYQIPDIHTDFADFRVREAFKHVQLHIEWPIWIRTRMIDSDEYQQIQSIGSMRYQNLLI